MTPSIFCDRADHWIFPAGTSTDPLGLLPTLELIDQYATAARQREQQGADRIVLRDMPDLIQARAAVLGARTVELPVYVTLSAPSDTWTEEEVLAALLCLQELGICGFGLDFGHVTAGVLAQLNQLTPYAKVPLLARPDSAASASQMASLLQAGARLLCCTAGEEVQTAAAHQAVAETVLIAPPPRPEDAPLLLCDESGVYYLEEDFTLSEEIPCSRDMSEAILDQEEQAVDALCFHITSVDDALHFGENAHMARCAVCLLAEQEEALETALSLYCGRALVDARSDVEEETLLALAARYGGVVR